MDGSPEAVFKLGNNAPATESGSTTQVTVTTKDGSDMVTPGVVSDEDDAEPTINLSITEGNTVIQWDLQKDITGNYTQAVIIIINIVIMFTIILAISMFSTVNIISGKLYENKTQTNLHRIIESPPSRDTRKTGYDNEHFYRQPHV